MVTSGCADTAAKVKAMRKQLSYMILISDNYFLFLFMASSHQVSFDSVLDGALSLLQIAEFSTSRIFIDSVICSVICVHYILLPF